jgi:hypothetical protein
MLNILPAATEITTRQESPQPSAVPIVEIRPGIGQAMLGPLAGLCVETSAGSVCFPLAGKGTVGIGPVDAPELAEKLEALRRGARNKIN